MRKQTLEIICVYILVILLTILYWAIIPHMGAAPRIVLMYLFYLLMVAIPVLLCKISKRPLASLGFRKNGLAKQILAGFALSAVLLLLVVGFPLLLHVPLSDIIGGKITDVREVLFQLPYTILFVGFGEEILFRGYFLERIKALTSSDAVAIALSSLLFGFWHYFASYSVMQVVVTALIGAFLAYTRTKYKHCTTLSVALSHGFYDVSLVLLRFFCV